MKSINFSNRKNRGECLHIETDLGIINIYVSMVDSLGRRNECIEILPNNYAGEKRVRLIKGRLVENKSI